MPIIHLSFLLGKMASTWNKTQEYDISSYGVTEPLTSSDITLPMILTPDLPNVWLDLSNYNPRYNTKSGGVWTNTAISQYSGFGNISTRKLKRREMPLIFLCGLAEILLFFITKR